MKQTVVKTYRGERALERGIENMRRQGYEVDQANPRKVVWSPVTGVFTRKQKHTIVFRRSAAAAAATARAAARATAVATARATSAGRDITDHSETCVCADCCAARLARKKR
jgi:predicted membrane GTPase involved in stress response